MTTIIPIRPEGAVLPALEASGIRVVLDDGRVVLPEAGLLVWPGEIVALVGESGAGKTTLANAILGYARPGATLVSGEVLIDGQNLLALSPDALRRARGARVAHVPQDPGGALDPLMRIGAHFDEMLSLHAPELTGAQRTKRVADILKEVDLPATGEFLRRFPHQLSGGQQQRILLALAFILKPGLIVLDEPTTALDPHSEALIVGLVRDLCRSHGAGAVYVSHNLAVVEALADRVVVLYAGRVVENAKTADFFVSAAHPYSRGLINAVPGSGYRILPDAIVGRAPSVGERPDGCAFAPRCAFATAACGLSIPVLQPAGLERAVACLHHPLPAEPIRRRSAAVVDVASQKRDIAILEGQGLVVSRGGNVILNNVSFTLGEGRCTALLGASGSGKTTLSRALAGIDRIDDGVLFFRGDVLTTDGKSRDASQRYAVQYVFQNAARALNPRQKIGQILISAVRLIDGTGKADAQKRARELLAEVSLGEEVLSLYPADLSGGERQRVAIARGLASRPSLLICDEITSALDVSVQASLLATLSRVREQGISLLLVTHDLGVVRAIADDVIVMADGRIVESGLVKAVFDGPCSAVARRLISPVKELKKESLVSA